MPDVKEEIKILEDQIQNLNRIVEKHRVGPLKGIIPPTPIISNFEKILEEKKRQLDNLKNNLE